MGITYFAEHVVKNIIVCNVQQADKPYISGLPVSNLIVAFIELNPIYNIYILCAFIYVYNKENVHLTWNKISDIWKVK